MISESIARGMPPGVAQKAKEQKKKKISQLLLTVLYVLNLLLLLSFQGQILEMVGRMKRSKSAGPHKYKASVLSFEWHPES